MTVAIKTEAPEETSAEKRQPARENRVRHQRPLRDPAFVQKIAQAEGKLLTAQQELDALRAGDPKKNRKLIKRAENKLRGLADDLANIQSVELAAYALMGEAREAILRGIQRGETSRPRSLRLQTSPVMSAAHGSLNKGVRVGAFRLWFTAGDCAPGT